MKDTFQIILKRGDLGQLLDGLRLRSEAWEKTADYWEFGFSPDDCFICEGTAYPTGPRQGWGVFEQEGKW